MALAFIKETLEELNGTCAMNHVPEKQPEDIFSLLSRSELTELILALPESATSKERQVAAQRVWFASKSAEARHRYGADIGPQVRVTRREMNQAAELAVLSREELEGLARFR